MDNSSFPYIVVNTIAIEHALIYINFLNLSL